eukprot:1505136-Pleurochrysis_carterae.AAC.1
MPGAAPTGRPAPPLLPGRIMPCRDEGRSPCMPRSQSGPLPSTCFPVLCGAKCEQEGAAGRSSA